MPDSIRRHGGLLVALAAFGSVALAVALQQFADMAPCAWCTFQRLIYLAVGVVALIAWRLPGGAGRVLAALGGLGALGGLAAALWQQFVASKSASCALTLADKVVKGLGLDESLPVLFKATAFCDEANVPLAGIPFAVWSAVLFTALAALLFIVALGRGARR